MDTKTRLYEVEFSFQLGEWHLRKTRKWHSNNIDATVKNYLDNEEKNERLLVPRSEIKIKTKLLT